MPRKIRSAPPAATAHVELFSPDAQRSADFYSALLGWQFQPVKMKSGGTYLAIHPGTGPTGGILQIAAPRHTTSRAAPPAAPGWAVFINVSKLTPTVARAKKLGAKVLAAHVPVPAFGAYATLQDPVGAVFHLWQSQKS